MSARKVDLLLPLLVVVLAGGAVALVVGLTGSSATEPGPPTPFEQEVSNPPSPFGPDVPVRVIDAKDQTGFAAFGNSEPKVDPRELPPLPPPFGTGKRINPDGSITTSSDPVSPEIQRKIEELKKRRFPGMRTEEEGD
jgi:hypothetical protein